ncbi:MAG: GNAT family N-acetyltransferase [Spirochaetales bacterium]|nr:GNAT family N-acetyltransferase [Spirochaetales bacterium]
MSQTKEKQLTVDFLKNYPQYLESVAKWIFAEWGSSSGDPTVDSTRVRIAKRMRDDAIPLTMIALLDGEPAGTVSLKIDDMDTRPDLTPWLAGVYVKEGMRERGIGSVMVKAAEETAKRLGTRRLYLFTPNRRSFYERMMWDFLENAEYRGEQVTIMAKNLL